MEPVVSLRAAVALAGRFPVLTGADLTVEAGEVLLLRGANGAGKTSLLRACAGLLVVASGSATVLGHDLTDPAQRRAVRRRVGLLGHGNALYDDLTVSDNVRFWARAAGATRDEADAAMARLGLDGRLGGVVAARLSAGQRRRVSLACLVARRPELWLLDEPHAGLDQAGRDVVDGLLRAAVAAGATVVLASHELDRAVAVATRTAEVAGGAVRSPVPAPDVPSQVTTDVG
jgi:heme ABC exporter ATP-binding subunit CcmA